MVGGRASGTVRSRGVSLPINLRSGPATFGCLPAAARLNGGCFWRSRGCFRFVASLRGWPPLLRGLGGCLSSWCGACLFCPPPPDFWVDRELCFPGGGWLLRFAVASLCSLFFCLCLLFFSLLPFARRTSVVALSAAAVALRARRAGRLLAGIRAGRRAPCGGLGGPYGGGRVFVALCVCGFCGFCCL